MAHFHPPIQPEFFSEKIRDAERTVWQNLQNLDQSWHVFYSARENSLSGRDREVDFILIRLNRIFYCEVKGGVVVVDQRVGPGVTWAHFTRAGEPIAKRVDPKQLWNAKAALGKTIRAISGHSPRELGFLEHDVYIFPHTSRAVTGGQDFERGLLHYVFAEDVESLPTRLKQIVSANTGVFIPPDRINSILGSLDAMVIGNGGGALPQQQAASPVYDGYRTQSHTSRVLTVVTRQLRRWHYRSRRGFFALASVAVGLLAISSFSGIDKVMEFAAKLISASTSSPVKQPSRPVSSAPASAPKALSARDESSLPSFITPSSADEVERAIAAAQDYAVYVSWQNDTQYGFVILRADEGNGCRRYQVSRHDVRPAVYDTVRRCS